MLDEYYFEQMKEVITNCSRTRQTMLFSATMTDQVSLNRIYFIYRYFFYYQIDQRSYSSFPESPGSIVY